MKKLAIVLALTASAIVGCGDATGVAASNVKAETEPDYGPGFWDSEVDTTEEDLEGGETNRDLPTPEEIEVIERELGVQPFLSFAQKTWNECSGKLTGHYSTYACVKRRKISVILDTFLQQHLLKCVEEGMEAQTGSGSVQKVHLVHAGITGDPRHSPRSLHSFNRAIDIKVIRATLSNGSTRQYTYSKSGNRTFYTALRKCWGRVAHNYNECPYYKGSSMLTGSIGWENSNHGYHMHLSIPYCYNNRYGSGAWQR